MNDETRGHRVTSGGTQSAIDLTNLPPGPYEVFDMGHSVLVNDADGADFAQLYGAHPQKLALANLIVLAQEFFTDRLDLVRRQAEDLVDAIRSSKVGATLAEERASINHLFDQSREDCIRAVMTALATASIAKADGVGS